ncbi:hypothetical protein CerSpe_046340 [Prunus speciosa]
MNDHKKADFLNALLDKLKHSLSLALVHFYPLAGRLATKKEENPPLYLVYVDCNNSPGARFIYATLDMSISDILSPTDAPLVVQSFFDHDRAVNHDGHTMSLLTAQVTELVDGIFIGLSMNHCLGDGTSYWHFFNTWSEIFQAKTQTPGSRSIIPTNPRPPVLKCWFPEGHGPIISLPFTHPDEFIDRFEAPELRESFPLLLRSHSQTQSKGQCRLYNHPNLFLPVPVRPSLALHHSGAASTSKPANHLQTGGEQPAEIKSAIVGRLLRKLTSTDQIRSCDSRRVARTWGWLGGVEVARSRG